MEERNAVITDVDGSKMRDSDGTIVDFTNPGGVSVFVSDQVVYIRIVTGNGQTINVIQKKV